MAITISENQVRYNYDLHISSLIVPNGIYRMQHGIHGGPPEKGCLNILHQGKRTSADLPLAIHQMTYDRGPQPKEGNGAPLGSQVSTLLCDLGFFVIFFGISETDEEKLST